MAVGAALVAALTVVAYARDRSGDPGVTTEIALLLAYLIGVTCARDQLLAAALAVVVTGLMALRDTLHQFANQWLQPGEVRSGLILAALALLVYPLAPDTPLWQGVLNPQVMVRLVIVLLVIQSLAHVAKRLMQARHALALSALASGFVSSTATIASLGMEVRTGHSAPRAHAGAAVLSCVATMVQIAVVATTGKGWHRCAIVARQGEALDQGCCLLYCGDPHVEHFIGVGHGSPRLQQRAAGPAARCNSMPVQTARHRYLISR